MIKNLLYTTSLIIALLSNLISNAQCTPDKNLKTTGVYPKTFTSTCIDQTMTQTLQVVVPANATVPNINLEVAVDSFEITKIENTPTGITYECASPNCKIKITDKNNVTNTCVYFSGKPTQVYNDSIIVSALFYTNFGPITQKHKIAFKVLAADAPECNPTAIHDVIHKKTINVYPNPSNGISKIELNLQSVANVQAIIYNAIGNQTAILFDGNTNSTTLTTPNLNQGIYFVQIVINGKTHLEKLIIK